MSHIELLKQTGIFDDLSEEDLASIAQGCSEQNYPMGTVIIEENDAPKEMLFIIKEGEIVISTGSMTEDKDDASFLTTLGPGDAFGEVSLIDNDPHSATVRTLTDSTVLLFSGKHFEKLIEEDKNIGFVVIKNIARLICQRLRSANFYSKHFGLFGRLDS